MSVYMIAPKYLEKYTKYSIEINTFDIIEV